jgi:hypothetical protein
MATSELVACTARLIDATFKFRNRPSSWVQVRTSEEIVRLFKFPLLSVYNPSFSACFSSQNSIFSLTTNQSTIFFSRLISTAERLRFQFLPPSHWTVAVGAENGKRRLACTHYGSKQSKAMFRRQTLAPKNNIWHYTKRRFSITSKCRHMYEVLNIDEIKN